jgi:integrase/recombinase XerD
MSKLREQMKRDLDLRGFAELTKKSYLAHIERYAKYFNESPEKLDDEHIKRYLHFLEKEKGLSRAYNAQAYSALKFLYETTMKKDWSNYRIPRSKKVRKLPIVLTKTEIRKIFREVKNLKQKAMLMTIYSAGLRVSECEKLKVSDIESENRRIKIRDAKGNKERYTLLGETNYEILKDYWKIHRPQEYLFPGQNNGTHITSRSIQKAFERAKKKAGIKKKATVHSLRHSFASHLLEDGVDVFHIQKLLGHANVKTTAIYIHVSQSKTLSIKSPLEEISDKC